MELFSKNKEYIDWLGTLKRRIQSAQIKSAITVNQELLGLYWDLGRSISEKINESKWGNSVVERLASDLARDFPLQKGFSRSNLFSMRRWYEFYSDSVNDIEFVQQLVGQIPWGQNIVIISKSETVEEAIFYCKKTIENNWSRSMLTHQIESSLFLRLGKAINNFAITLPEPQSDLAQETFKDPYKLDFLLLQEKALERDLENQLVNHITSFLLELGSGFSFIGRQFPIAIAENDYFIDLLFYHIKLRCYVVVELKTTDFKAEFTGKMNLYLSAIDDKLKTEADNPTIGLLLCQSKNEIVAEYALRGMTQPIGIAEYELSKAIPENLKSQLPTIEQLETELSKLKKEK